MKFVAIVVVIALLAGAAAEEAKLSLGDEITISPAAPRLNQTFDVSFSVLNKGAVGFNGVINIDLAIDSTVVANKMENVSIPAHGSLQMFFEKGGSINESGSHIVEVRMSYFGGTSNRWKEFIVGNEATTPALNGSVKRTITEHISRTESPFRLDMNLLVLLILVIVSAIVALIALRARARKKRERAEKAADKLRTKESELNGLMKEKAAIKESLEIARQSYFKRKIDEDMYRNIVEESNNKLFLADTRIEKLKASK